jgi:hypothetical protein
MVVIITETHSVSCNTGTESSVWVRNLVSDIEGRIWTEGVREQGAEEISAFNIARNLPVNLRFTRGTRILLRPDVLCAMPSHSVAHVFLTLQCNDVGRASFEVHESQRDLRFGKLLLTLNHDYSRQYSLWFATLRQLKTLHMSSE